MPLELNTVHHGDALTVLKTLPDECVDSVTTDPPYGLGQDDPTPGEILAYLMGADLKTGDFMGKDWDIPPVAVWKECFRVLKPGGHLLAFGGTRTNDLISMGIRMAGFENRDTIASLFGSGQLLWVQSQGFPKSHNIDKAIDRQKGATRKVVGTKRGVGGDNLNDIVHGREVRQTTDEGGKGIGAYGVGAKQVGIDIPVTAPESEEAKQWEGWGTALKPSHEPILMFRKPIREKSVVAQVLKTGTGAINIDACRIGAGEARKIWNYGSVGAQGCITHTGVAGHAGEPTHERVETSGRWPANLVLIHSDGCKIVGTKKVKAPVINRFDDGMKPFGNGAGHGYTSVQTGDEKGQEEVLVYECLPGCPVKELDAQSGVLKTGAWDGTRTKPKSTEIYNDPLGTMKEPARPADEGGASRFFAQFEAESVYECVPGCPVKELNEQSGFSVSRPDKRDSGSMDTRNDTENWRFKRQPSNVNDSGGASRFYAQFEPEAPFLYCAKAAPAEKNVGEGVEEHPTVKPLKLMRYLVRLVTPPGGVVLDPYVGSGTTAVAAVLEGMNFVVIEKHEPYLERIRLRLEMARTGDVGSKRAPIAESPQGQKEPSNWLLELALSDE